MLNIDKVHYYDMFAPIVEEQNSEISYDKAISLAYAALGPLGDQYEDIKWVVDIVYLSMQTIHIYYLTMIIR